MHIVSKYQDQALLLLQIAQEVPELEAQATYLAHQWLAAAAIRISTGRVERPENEVRPD
jgi:hypothetical protein